jgi:hypothetical protein
MRPGVDVAFAARAVRRALLLGSSLGAAAVSPAAVWAGDRATTAIARAARLASEAGAWPRWVRALGFALAPILVFGGLVFVVESGVLTAVLEASGRRPRSCKPITSRPACCRRRGGQPRQRDHEDREGETRDPCTSSACHSVAA